MNTQVGQKAHLLETTHGTRIVGVKVLVVRNLGVLGGMRRRWLRPITFVSLAAFLAANSHIGATVAALSALQVRFFSAPAHDHARPSKESGASAATPCRHSGHTPSWHFETAGVADNCGHVPRSPSCPDCPKGPDSPSGPCSSHDGCAMCNAAKVPCLTHTISITTSASCLSEALPEPTSCYRSPLAGRVIRPPRA